MCTEASTSNSDDDDEDDVQTNSDTDQAPPHHRQQLLLLLLLNCSHRICVKCASWRSVTHYNALCRVDTNDYVRHALHRWNSKLAGALFAPLP